VRKVESSKGDGEAGSEGVENGVDSVWRDEYHGREDFTMFEVRAVLKSAFPFSFSANTYVKTSKNTCNRKGMKSASLG